MQCSGNNDKCMQTVPKFEQQFTSNLYEAEENDCVVQENDVHLVAFWKETRAWASFLAPERFHARVYLFSPINVDLF